MKFIEICQYSCCPWYVQYNVIISVIIFKFVCHRNNQIPPVKWTHIRSLTMVILSLLSSTSSYCFTLTLSWKCLQSTSGQSASFSTKRYGLRDSWKRIRWVPWDIGFWWHCLNNFETIPLKWVTISRTLVEKLTGS